MRMPCPETVIFRAPEGFHAVVKAAAAREGLSLSAYLRRLALVAANGGSDDRHTRRRKLPEQHDSTPQIAA